MFLFCSKVTLLQKHNTYDNIIGILYTLNVLNFYRNLYNFLQIRNHYVNLHHRNKQLYYCVQKYGALICYELVYISKLVLLNIKTCKGKGAIALKQEARTHRLTHDITVVISCLRRQLQSSFESFFRGEEIRRIKSSKIVITTIHKLISLSW